MRVTFNHIATTIAIFTAVTGVVNGVAAVMTKSATKAADAKAREIFNSGCVQVGLPLTPGVEVTADGLPIGPGVPVCYKAATAGITDQDSRVYTIYAIEDWRTYQQEKARRTPSKPETTLRRP